jgi:hypothetical protein
MTRGWDLRCPAKDPLRPWARESPKSQSTDRWVADQRKRGGGPGCFACWRPGQAVTCATCPQVRRVLTDLATSEAGVVHVDLLSEEHMDLVRRFSVYRTPTVLLLDPQGAVASRTSGPLTPARAVAALAELSHDTTRSIDV